MFRSVLTALALSSLTALVAPGEATAQSARPGVDCSLLTPQQAQGLPCATAPKAPEPPPFVPSLEACRGVNPYDDVAKALACIAWDRAQRQEPPLPTFVVGATYVHPYPHIRMIVLAVSLTLDGVPVVTAQYTAGEQTGEVFAFRTDQGSPWLRESFDVNNAILVDVGQAPR